MSRMRNGAMLVLLPAAPLSSPVPESRRVAPKLKPSSSHEPAASVRSVTDGERERVCAAVQTSHVCVVACRLAVRRAGWPSGAAGGSARSSSLSLGASSCAAKRLPNTDSRTGSYASPRRQCACVSSTRPIDPPSTAPRETPVSDEATTLRATGAPEPLRSGRCRHPSTRPLRLTHA